MKKILAHHYIDEKTGKVITQRLDNHLMNVAIESKRMALTIECESILFLLGLFHDLGKASEKFQNYLLNLTSQKVNHSSAGGKLLMELCDKILKNHFDFVDSVEFEIFKLFKEALSYVIFAHHGFFDLINLNGEYVVNVFEKRKNYDIDNSNKNYQEVKDYFDSLLPKIKEKIGYSIDDLIIKAFEEFRAVYEKIDKLSSNIIAKTESNINHGGNDKVKKSEGNERYENSKHFYIHFLIRLFLSILKEADITDTIKHSPVGIVEEYSKDELEDFWNNCLNNVEKKYQKFESVESNVAKSRCLFSRNVKENAKINSFGVHKFYLPTGGGKNIASLRYALENRNIFSKQRIIYLASFVSILEQNAFEIKKAILEYEDESDLYNKLNSLEKFVLEHHSNVGAEKNNIFDTTQGFTAHNKSKNLDDDISEEDDENNLREIEKKYIKDSWIAPFILTTTVQFFNTLFGGKASNIRRFSKLIDSVIIIDELQSLPPKFTYLINLSLNFISNIMRTNVVLSTATQPKLDYKALTYPIIYGGNNDKGLKDLIDLSKLDGNLLKVFDRCDIINMTEKLGRVKIDTANLTDFIYEHMLDSKSVLLVLNTRSAVKRMYDALSLDKRGEGVKIIYLTTFLCASHRLEQINKIKNLVKSGKKVICISTNLIEAGVDLDFDIAVRSRTGIDSIIQTAGRCNREGKLALRGKKGKVYVINYSGENISNISELKKASDITQGVFNSASKNNLISEDNILLNYESIKDKYYEKYYDFYKSDLSARILINKNKVEYIDLLGFNRNKRNSFRSLSGESFDNTIAQDFKFVSNNLRLIDDNGIGIIVRYKNDKTIESLIKACEMTDYFAIKENLTRLQSYTVSLREHQLKLIEDKYDVYFNGIMILKSEYYKEDIGVDFESEVKLEDLII